MSRVGIDALVRGRTEENAFSSTWLIRVEADWKGDSESDRWFLRGEVVRRSCGVRESGRNHKAVAATAPQTGGTLPAVFAAITIAGELCGA